MDVVVTVPKRFGLQAWIAAGDPAETPGAGTHSTRWERNRRRKTSHGQHS